VSAKARCAPSNLRNAAPPLAARALLDGGQAAVAPDADRDEVRGVIETTIGAGDDVMGAESVVAAASNAGTVACDDHR
jgi:hypothetical protein